MLTFLKTDLSCAFLDLIYKKVYSSHSLEILDFCPFLYAFFSSVGYLLPQLFGVSWIALAPEMSVLHGVYWTAST